MSTTSGVIDICRWSSFIFRVVITTDQSVKLITKVSELDQNTGEARDYVEVAARAGCVIAEGVAIRSDWTLAGLGGRVSDLTENLSTQIPSVPPSVLAAVGYAIAETSSRGSLNTNKVLIMAFRIQDIYCRANSMSRLFFPSPLVGLAFNTGLKVVGKVFPQQQDNLFLSSHRQNIRGIFDECLEARGPKAKRFVYIALPDNLGYATAFLSSYLTYRGDSVRMEDTVMLTAMALTTVSVLHLFREHSWRILAPVSRGIPFIGSYLSSFFKRLGPSDRVEQNGM